MLNIDSRKNNKLVQLPNPVSTKNKLIKAITNPLWSLGCILKRAPWLIKDDEKYMKWIFFLNMGYWPDFDHPQTYNEKMNWAKLHDKHPEYTEMVDKYEAKNYVARVLGTSDNIIPTIGVWDNAEDINFDELPSQFVLKTTHDSGGIVICKDKSKLDTNKAKKKLAKCLNTSMWKAFREYPYKDVQRRIIAEKYMVDESGTELKDYKFFCFNGEPKMLFIATDRPLDTRFDFFDMNFNHLPFLQGHPWASKEIKKPKNFESMVEIAKKLSAGIPHVRVDLYNVDGKIYFGELTFFHFSGCTPIVPFDWDKKIGSWWNISDRPQ